MFIYRKQGNQSGILEWLNPRNYAEAQPTTNRGSPASGGLFIPTWVVETTQVGLREQETDLDFQLMFVLPR